MRLVGERRALASLVFAIWFLLYLLSAVLGPPANAKFLYSMAGVYGLAFLSLVAGYFWARWYAVGVGLFGVIIGAVALWKIGFDEQVIILGGSHLLATVMLWGNGMAAAYDGQTAWREKFHMDDNAVHRLGRSVIRAGASLPLVLAYAFAPKEPASLILGVGALVATGLGLRAIVRMRAWGLVALGAAGAALVSLGFATALAGHDMLALSPALGGALLLSAVAPWLRPIARTLV